MKQAIRGMLPTAALATAVTAVAVSCAAASTPAATTYMAVARQPAAAAAPATTCHIYNWTALPGNTYSAIAHAVYGDAGKWRYIAALNPWSPWAIPAYAHVRWPYPYWCGRGAGLA